MMTKTIQTKTRTRTSTATQTTRLWFCLVAGCVLFLECFWVASSFRADVAVSRRYHQVPLVPRRVSNRRLGIDQFCGAFASISSSRGDSEGSIIGDGDHHLDVHDSATTTTATTEKKPLSWHLPSLLSHVPISSTSLSDQHHHHHHSSWSLPRRAVELYTDYAGRLWNETNMDARQRISGDRAVRLIRQLQQVLRQEESTVVQSDVLQVREKQKAGGGQSSVSLERKSVLNACDRYLEILKAKTAATTTTTTTTTAASEVEDNVLMNVTKDLVFENGENYVATTIANRQAAVAVVSSASSSRSSSETGKKKQPRRSILFGAAMGLVVAGWVFSGNYIFTGVFTLMTILGQLEYYRMVINTGVYPARRISIVGACSMFLTALFTPNLHQICLPMFGLWAMVWFLTMKRTVTTIPEIATTFTGMFYLGYVPSFWVRIRLLNTVVGDSTIPKTQLAPLAAPFLNWMAKVFGRRLPDQLTQAIHLPITTGAIFIFWTWLCLAFSDVGAYFVGRKFGKTKLGAIAPAAGATSPNKSVEGVIGGCAASAALAILGAWVQQWPYFVWTGAIHGILLGILGLVGDLTASMLKRDAGLKDFGDLIPEHGGIMDRVDSFVWAAPYSWLVCSYVIPALKTWCR